MAFGRAAATLLVSLVVAACGRTERDGNEPSRTSDRGPAACALDVSSGDGHACALYEDGSVFCWGDNQFGQLGDGSQQASLEPVDTGLRGILAIASGGAHTCALDEQQAVWCWGSEFNGSLVPALVEGQEGFAIAAGSSHSCVLDRSMRPYCWGTDADGDHFASPKLVEVEIPWLQIEAGAGVTLLVNELGLVAQISDFDAPARVITHARTGNAGVAMGGSGRCLLKASGSVWCSSSLEDEPFWRRLDFATDNALIAASSASTCTVTHSGRVRCSEGEHAQDSLDGVVRVSAGMDQACVVRSDGSIWCWGVVGDRTLTNVSSCAARTTSAALPLATPPAPVVQFGEGATAWAQAVCACSGLGEQSCVSAEDRGDSPGCLFAFAGDSPEVYACYGEALWAAAECTLERCPGSCVPDTEHCPPLGPAAWCVRYSSSCGVGSELFRNEQLCDGIANCSNGFDEVNCLPGPEFSCSSGEIIARSSVCDGSDDCADSSDECSL